MTGPAPTPPGEDYVLAFFNTPNEPDPQPSLYKGVYTQKVYVPDSAGSNYGIDSKPVTLKPEGPSAMPTIAAKSVAMPFGDKVKALQPQAPLPKPGSVPLVTMKESKAEKDKGVKYVDSASERRQRYEITMAASMKRGADDGLRVPEEFDTASIKAKFNKSDPTSLGSCKLWRDPSEMILFRELIQEWSQKSLIWVCANEPGRLGAMFYSHVGLIGKFHHSSFKEGEDVIGAGEWIVEKGKLKRISANSGHYLPKLDEFHRSVLYMAAAWQQDTEVLLWNKKDQKWEYVSVQSFKVSPGGGGKYATHPLSA